MDTMIPDHDEAEFGDVIALLRRTYEVRAEDVEALPPATITHRRSPRRPDRRVLLSVAAAALIAVGAAGIVTLRGREDSDPGTDTSAPTPTSAIVETVAPTTTAPATSSGHPPVTWFVPTDVPDGYELSQIGANFRPIVPPDDSDAICCGDEGLYAVSLPDFSGQQRWVHPAAAGGPTRWISARAQYEPAATLDEAPGEGIRAVVIHGIDGILDQRPGTDPHVTWIEASSTITVSSSEVSEEQLIAIAEASTVGQGSIALDPATVPEGYELAHPLEGVDPNIEHQQLLIGGLTAIDGTDNPIWFWARTATMSLDYLVDHETERRTVDGVEYSIQVASFDPQSVTVRWVTAGFELELTGIVGVDLAVATATSIEEMPAAAAADIDRAATESMLAMPTLASGVFADGTRVSIHARENEGRHVAAICVETAEPQCLRPVETRDGATWRTDVFEIDGLLRLIVWDTQIAEPTAEGLSAEVVAATSGSGAFASIPLETDFPIPVVNWTNDAGQVAGSNPDFWIRP